MTINFATVSGNLTRDCDERRTKNGMTIVSFTVAVNERRKNNQTGEYDDYTNYIGCAVFGKYADSLAPSLVKGTRVTVAGALRYSQWEKDGEKKSKLEIIANSVEVPKIKQSKPSNNFSVPQFEEVTVYESADIPF